MGEGVPVGMGGINSKGEDFKEVRKPARLTQGNTESSINGHPQQTVQLGLLMHPYNGIILGSVYRGRQTSVCQDWKDLQADVGGHVL